MPQRTEAVPPWVELAKSSSEQRRERVSHGQGSIEMISSLYTAIYFGGSLRVKLIYGKNRFHFRLPEGSKQLQGYLSSVKLVHSPDDLPGPWPHPM
jgi:hypothetical protein